MLLLSSREPEGRVGEESVLEIGGLIARHARYRPRHTAVVFGEQRIDYARLQSRVERLAGALLALGLRKGDKLATVLPNC